MKNFKFSHLFLAIVGVLTFAACQHEHADWTPGDPDSNLGVHFPSIETYEVSAEDTTVSIPVKRLSNIDVAAEVSYRWLDLSDEDGDNENSLFSTSNSVKFEAQKDVAYIEFTFDGSKLEIGKEYPINIKLSEADASNYGIYDATFTIIIPEPWFPYGATEDESTGIYFDDFLAGMFDDPSYFQGAGTYVQFERSGLNDKVIRTVDLFSKESVAFMLGGLPDWLAFTATGHSYVPFDISDPNNVILLGQKETIRDGLIINYVPIYINMTLSDGSNYDLVLGQYIVEGETEPIKLENGIIKFPTDASIVLGALSGGKYAGYMYEANPSGFMQLYLPGTEFVDYNMIATYDGMTVSPDGSSVKAIFNFTLGADVASYKFAFAEGDYEADPSEIVEAIVAGSEDLTIYESDIETTKWDVELSRGVYTLVAVPYTAEGEARTQDAIAVYLYFNGAPEMPNVEYDIKIGAPKSFVSPEEADAKEAEYPACYNIGVAMTANGDEVRSIKVVVTDPGYVEKEKITLDELFSVYATDVTSLWLPELKENDYVLGNLNVNANSSNKVYIRIETIYGKFMDYVSEEYTLPEYDGDLVIGTYDITAPVEVTNAEGEKETKDRTIQFGLKPYKSYDSFLFVHSLDTTEWHAKYDKENSTLTISGIMNGNEAQGCMYGDYIGTFNADGTQVYGYFSSSNADSQVFNEPLVFNIVDGKLASLASYFTMRVAELTAEGEIGQYLFDYFAFTPDNATVELYVKDENPEDDNQGSDDNTGGSDDNTGGSDDNTQEPTPSALSSSTSERVEIVKPYYGEYKFNAAPATLKMF